MDSFRVFQVHEHETDSVEEDSTAAFADETQKWQFNRFRSVNALNIVSINTNLTFGSNRNVCILILNQRRLP